MENRAKELQRQLFADRTSSPLFFANQMRVTLAAAAYVLMDDVRRIGCKGSEFAACEVATLRTKLIKVGARITISVRRFVAHCSSSYPYQDAFAQIARNLMRSAMPAAP